MIRSGVVMEQVWILAFLYVLIHIMQKKKVKIIFFIFIYAGIESFSKLGDSIYFEEAGEKPGLYIIQYISSSVNWKLGQIFIDQKQMPVVSWDPRLRVTTTISSKKVKGCNLLNMLLLPLLVQFKMHAVLYGYMQEGFSSTLHYRIPFWTTLDAKATLNGQGIPEVSAGMHLLITG